MSKLNPSTCSILTGILGYRSETPSSKFRGGSSRTTPRLSRTCSPYLSRLTVTEQLKARLMSTRWCWRASRRTSFVRSYGRCLHRKLITPEHLVASGSPHQIVCYTQHTGTTAQTTRRRLISLSTNGPQSSNSRLCGVSHASDVPPSIQ